MKHIIKRKGHSEVYDVRKLYASVYSMCLSVHSSEKDAENTAEKVVQHVDQWLEMKHEVTAHDIHTIASDKLMSLNPDAGFLYSNHRGIHE